jgi:Outer membrane protein
VAGQTWRHTIHRTTNFALSRAALLAGLIAAQLSLGGCTTVGDLLGLNTPERDSLPSVDAAVANPVAYEVRIAGDVPEAVRGPLNASLSLLTEKDRLPASFGALSKRADNDVGRAKDVLASEGYYEADVRVTIDGDVEPAVVVLDVSPGPQYRLGAVDISYTPDQPVTTVPATASDIGLTIGQVAAGAPLVEAERRLIRLMQENSYPNATLAQRQYLADRETKEVRAVYTVETGPFARFGPLTVSGLKDVNAEYIERITAWESGTAYDIRQIERVRQTLAKTQLFATISPPPRDNLPVGDDGTVPVDFAVTERPEHSVGVGAFYSTDEDGPGGSVSWEDRNLFGNAERLRVSLEGSMVRQTGEVDFRKPAFYQLNQSLLANVTVLNNDTDAYKGLTGSGSVAIERKFLPYWTVSAGPAFLYTNITRSAANDAGDQYFLGGGKLRVGYDSRDDVLDPTKGLNGSLSISPYASLALTQTQFMITDAALSGYQGLFENNRVVLAARTRVGSIVGDSNSGVPASLRFYAGGGGSVRGYKFQSIGPLDDKNDPIGGRSLIEVNTEARIKIIDEFGIVPFLDGGQVYETEYPDFSSDLQWAGGLGLRYYSPIGPVRLDVAAPINPRSSDDAYQFYISIGQAF